MRQRKAKMLKRIHEKQSKGKLQDILFIGANGCRYNPFKRTFRAFKRDSKDWCINDLFKAMLEVRVGT